MATLLALVTAKHCSDLILLCINNKAPFSSVSCCYFLFLYLVVRQIDWVIFLLWFVLSLIPVLIFALFFNLKAYLRCTEPLRKKPDGFVCDLSVLG